MELERFVEGRFVPETQAADAEIARGNVETAREREPGEESALMPGESAPRRPHQQIDAGKVAAPVDGRVRYDGATGPGAVLADGQVAFRIGPDAASM